jgi:hypothetical protein
MQGKEEFATANNGSKFEFLSPAHSRQFVSIQHLEPAANLKELFGKAFAF